MASLSEELRPKQHRRGTRRWPKWIAVALQVTGLTVGSIR